MSKSKLSKLEDSLYELRREIHNLQNKKQVSSYYEISKDGESSRSTEMSDQFKLYLIGQGYKVEYKEDHEHFKSHNLQIDEDTAKLNKQISDTESLIEQLVSKRSIDVMKLWNICKKVELYEYKEGSYDNLSPLELFELLTK